MRQAKLVDANKFSVSGFILGQAGFRQEVPTRLAIALVHQISADDTWVEPQYLGHRTIAAARLQIPFGQAHPTQQRLRHSGRRWIEISVLALIAQVSVSHPVLSHLMSHFVGLQVTQTPDGADGVFLAYSSHMSPI